MLYYNNVPQSESHTFRDLSIGLLVGMLSGLFGVGGGIVLVPLLVLLFKVDQKKAQATSLFVVSLSAVTGAATYAIANTVNWIAAPLLIAGGLLGTYLGTAVVKKIKDRWLKIAFGGLLLVVAGRFVWQSFEAQSTSIIQFGFEVALGYLAAGFAMGLLSSFLGVGGGVILVPILVTLFGFPQQLAAGTSLIVMIPVTLLGAMRLSKSGFTNWAQGARIGAAAAVSAIAGASLALVADAAYLQLGFALVLVLAGTQMIWRAFR
jgi:hypothetical protein